ncbi:unnamed protein product [Brassica oleracea]|uniref:(rape) hypothetical protein n=1 Tax=Brassica napus TaxID=3708 RepID=A0A816QSD4_BRANA|nr:unnamed protein product [Brassica napus]
MESDHVMMMRTTASFRTRSCDDCVCVRASLRRELLCANSFYKKSKATSFVSLPSSLLDPYIGGFFEVSLKVQMGDSQYSFSLTTFSPSGKLVQIEHALTAVGSGQTSLGIKASNGVVIATEKKLPSILVDEASVQKIQNLTPNIGVVYSGMGPDFRVLVRKSRKQAEQYLRLYKEPIPVTQLVRETATVMQEFTQSGGVRPFGVSLLVAGYDDKGPQLYQVDPSGSYFSWKASAMGKNVSNAKTFLEKRYTEDMELDDAIHTAILTLKEGFEGEISSKNIEIGKIGADKVFRVLTPAEIDDYLAEVE